MWTAQNGGRYDHSQLRYSSDLTDDECAHVKPLIPPAKPCGNNPTDKAIETRGDDPAEIGLMLKEA